MIFLSRSEHLPIAIDLGHESVKVLQLQERGGALAVMAAAQQVMDSGELAGSDRVAIAIPHLRRLIHEGGFRGKQVAAVLPREFVKVKTIRLPVLPESDLKSAIELETGDLFTLPPEQLSIRFIPAGEVKQGTEPRLEVIVLAVETRLIDHLLEQFNQLGMIVSSLDFEPCAMYRGIERFVRRKEDENEVSVMVDIGAAQSQVVIGRGRDVTFTKTIEIGSRKLSDCVGRKLSLSQSEAASLRRRFAALDPAEKDPVRQTVVDATRNMMSDLAHEVSLCLRYYSVTFRGQRPTKVRLLGGEANDPSLRQALTQSLTVPVEIYHPFGGIKTSGTIIDSREGSLSEWGVAFGAALRHVKNTVQRHTDPQQRFGRREGDASVVEVVDLSAAIKTAGVMETTEPRRSRTEEATHA